MNLSLKIIHWKSKQQCTCLSLVWIVRFQGSSCSNFQHFTAIGPETVASYQELMNVMVIIAGAVTTVHTRVFNKVTATSWIKLSTYEQFHATE